MASKSHCRFQVLARLLAHPGRLATQEELQAQFWGEVSLFDAELGLNTLPFLHNALIA
jgi:DNA-binding response OmpR family regulator